MREWGIILLIVGLISLFLVGSQLAVLAIVAGVVMLLVSRR